MQAFATCLLASLANGITGEGMSERHHIHPRLWFCEGGREPACTCDCNCGGTFSADCKLGGCIRECGSHDDCCWCCCCCCCRCCCCCCSGCCKSCKRACDCEKS